MKLLKIFLCIALLMFASSVAISQSYQDCKDILDRRVSLAALQEGTEQLKVDFRVLALCNFDSIDYQIFMGPNQDLQGVTNLLDRSTRTRMEGEDLTFKSLLVELKEATRQSRHTRARKMLIARDRVFQRDAKVQNWDADKVLLSKMGFESSELRDIFDLVVKWQPLKYSDVLKIYSDNISVRREKLIKNSVSVYTEPAEPELEEVVEGLFAYRNYDKGVEKSRQSGLPILLYFNGFGTLNARRMERGVLGSREAKKYIAANFIMVSLKVDERIRIPESERYYSEVLDKQVVTIGNRNLEMEMRDYDSNSQPLLVILDAEFDEVAKIGYVEDAMEFMSFLKTLED